MLDPFGGTRPRCRSAGSPPRAAACLARSCGHERPAASRTFRRRRRPVDRAWAPFSRGGRRTGTRRRLCGREAPRPSVVVRAPSTRGHRTTDPPAMAAGASKTVLPGLVREVAGILRRRWTLAVPPAALLSAGAGAVVLLRHELGAELALGVLLAVAFEFYVGWAELVVAADRGEGARPRV